MAIRCGIDLGTTYSAISWYDSLNKRVDTIRLESANGLEMVRSVVYYPGLGQPPVVGDPAWNARMDKPERVIVAIKRSMGTNYKTGPIDDVQYTPPQVSAEILKTLVNDAQLQLGEEVKDVVITVPAYFGDNERAATLEAGQLAGLNVLAVLPEPHAAALAFAVDKVAEILDRALLVYDLGGGTFDVTLIRAKAATDPDRHIDLKIDTLCKDGNARLGGLDWDGVLAEIVAEKAQQAHGVDIRQDARNEAILLDSCEKAKRDLSRAPSAFIPVPGLTQHSIEVTVAEFEDRTRDLLYQSKALLEHVLEMAEKDHGLPRDQIDVLLAGGSSRMPMVRNMIKGVLGKPPLQHKNPELLVTIGAAYWAHLLESGQQMTVPVKTPEGKVEPRELVVGGLTDVSMFGVGIMVFRPDGGGGMKKMVSRVLPSGTRYEEEFTREFATSEDNMTEIPVILYQHRGEFQDQAAWEVDQCEPLMDVTIAGLPPGRPRGQPVKVALKYDQSGIIRGRAIDLITGKEVEIIEDREKKFTPTA